MIIAVALGGGLGAVGRYLLSGAVNQATLDSGFPWGTLSANVLGSFIMGAVVESASLVWQPSPELRAFITAGVLGGFTTFSSFSLDFAQLTEIGELGAAMAYLLASVSLSILALFLGFYVMRVVLY